MAARSTEERYGTVAVALHWVSAVSVLVLLAAGFFMPDLEGAMKTLVYRGHIVLGALVLLLTLARIGWRRFDEKPAPPPGIDGMHKFGFEAVHVLLVVGLLGAATSGVALSVQSGLGESLFFGSGSVPTNLWDYRPRMAHRVFSFAVAALALGHIGGVILHQLTKSDVMSRMGISGIRSGDE